MEETQHFWPNAVVKTSNTHAKESPIRYQHHRSPF